METVLLYDTTLRDGTQGEDINFSVQDKIRIAKKLDEFGIHYIEGGWPGSNPRDKLFFESAKRVVFKNARLAAFGSTRKPNSIAENDPNVCALLESETPVVTVFGKSWQLHVREVMNNTLEENLNMIRDTVACLKKNGREVVYDGEHFFDGYKDNREYALETLSAAFFAGADFFVLCDTNGGTLPFELESIVQDARRYLEEKSANSGMNRPVRIGIHTHDDSGLAVANTVSAVHSGAVMVQGTINGYGERCGNADLTSIIPILELKMGKKCVSEENLKNLLNLSRFVSETANVPPNKSRPYVGRSAFAHKGGIHVSAIRKT